MRTLTQTLLSAQQKESRLPAVSLQARNLLSGVVNLKWERLYTGSELDCGHALTIPADGSLIRFRTTPASDSRKLYRQRITSPGSGSDFSQWTYLSQSSVMAVAACSLGSEVSLFWVKSSGEIDRNKSIDNGQNWTLDYPGYAPTGYVPQMAAAYKPNGDLALFIADSATLYLIKRLSGSWQSRIAWNKSTSTLTGVAAFYDGDWKLLVSGQDSSGNYKLWSLIYGDGGEVTAGTWSDLKEIASAPSDAGYEFRGLFLDKPDTYRCFYTEKFTGSEASNRVYWSHTLPGTGFLESRWREPVPFETESQNGLDLAHANGYAWSTAPFGVWRASLAEESLDLSADILNLKADLGTDHGQLTIELNNSHGQYSSLLTPNSILNIGCQIDFSPGYRTTAGSEYSFGQSFILAGYEHISLPGKASLILYALDGWECLRRWIARYQFRWNKDAPVKEILAQVLARSGLKLEVISQSSVITGFSPDFTIHPRDNGHETIKRLLSFVPDVLFLEGNKAYLVNPLSTDSSIYSYGTGHKILEGRYRQYAWSINRVKVEGSGVTADSFSWSEILRNGDLSALIEDLNIDTVTRAHERGERYLRHAAISSHNSVIRVSVNTGQQLYDVVDITDSRAGQNTAKRRVLGLTLSYQPSRGEYQQKLLLGAA